MRDSVSAKLCKARLNKGHGEVVYRLFIETERGTFEVVLDRANDKELAMMQKRRLEYALRTGIVNLKEQSAIYTR